MLENWIGVPAAKNLGGVVGTFGEKGDCVSKQTAPNENPVRSKHEALEGGEKRLSHACVNGGCRVGASEKNSAGDWKRRNSRRSTPRNQRSLALFEGRED